MKDKELWLRTSTGIIIFGLFTFFYGLLQYGHGDSTTPIEAENYALTPSTRNVVNKVIAPITVSSNNMDDVKEEIYIKEETEHNSMLEDRQVLTRKASPMKKAIAAAEKVLYPVRPEQGETIGTLILPAIGKQMPIVHGTEEEQLEKGVGHYKGSVLPGEPDHTVLSGHRDTVFRSIGKMDLGDAIHVETEAGTFTYEIVETFIVDDDDKTVIQSTEGATLSLTTCYPFSFLGAAPERYIIQAVLTDYQLKQ